MEQGGTSHAPASPGGGPVVLVVGARPNFMKIAPLQAELDRRGVPSVLVHTGQHYDSAMSDVFFDELGIRPPDHHLEVGSASHAVQTARIMEAFEPVVLSHRPSWVVVPGDVNSTMACSLVAAKLGAPGYGVAVIPHPVSSRSADYLADVADRATQAVAAQLGSDR